MVFYIIFSYLILVGVRMNEDEFDGWNLVFAPITFPILLGKLISQLYKHNQK